MGPAAVKYTRTLSDLVDELVGGVLPVYAGIGVSPTRSDTPVNLSQQIALARELGADGLGRRPQQLRSFAENTQQVVARALLIRGVVKPAVGNFGVGDQLFGVGDRLFGSEIVQNQNPLPHVRFFFFLREANFSFRMGYFHRPIQEGKGEAGLA